MSADVLVMLCVNDPDNGMPTGRVCGADFQIDGDHVLSLETGFWNERDNPTCDIDGVRLRVGRRTFTIHGHSEWVGNWCWDGVLMPPGEAKRLVEHLLKRGFTKDMWTHGCPLLPNGV